jgi:hypothetical protein
MTDNPGQNGFGVAVMDTTAGRIELTIIVIAFDVAGLSIGQVMFEFKTQVITSPLLGKKEKTWWSVPTQMPSTFHW